MVALLTSVGVVVSFCSARLDKMQAHLRISKEVGAGHELTSRIIPRKQKRPRGAMQLCASIKDEFIRRQALVSHSAGHVMRRAVNDVVPEEILALPESAVIRF
jgi:hypothetical protein